METEHCSAWTFIFPWGICRSCHVVKTKMSRLHPGLGNTWDPAVVKVESLSEISPERMFVLGDRKISMKMVIRCHWIVKQVDHEKNKRRIILFRKDFPTRKNWDQCKESWALWLRMNAKNQRRNISFSSEEFKSIEVLLKVNPFK